MPFPRPVSPVTFETCVPLSDKDTDSESLLGSDDELDESQRSAKRQRIERLAESYLQGQPLFILSASLRGPFDQGWSNPWKKTRKKRHENAPNEPSADGPTRNTAPVVEETDPRPAKYRDDIPRSTRSAKAIPSRESVGSTDTASALKPGPTSDWKSGQERAPSASRHESSRASTRSPKKQREATSCFKNDYTFAGKGSVDWLKKDRRRMNFKLFEPPSSPTPKGSRHEYEKKARAMSSQVEKSRSLSGSSCARSSKKPAVPEWPPLDTAIQSPASVPSPSHVVRKASSVTQDSPKPSSSKPKDHTGSSFKVVSSSSQLPRFEYRRPRHEFSPLGQSKSSAREAAREPTPIVYLDGQSLNGIAEPSDADICDGDHPGQISREPPQPPLAQSPHLSKSLRFANDTEGTDSTCTHPQTTAEQNTDDNLPSAQEVPVPPGVSNCVPSLNSTALPRANHGQGEATSPDTQLSTQAALIHAQRSFQDDLETQEHDNGTPGLQRPGVDVGNDSLLAHETPLFRPDTLERAPRSFKSFDRDKATAMSTQCMIDAATPYTFSTEKKPTAFRSVEMEEQNVEKTDVDHTAEGSSRDPSSPSPGNDYHTAQSSPRSPTHQPAPAHTNPSTTQATPLPFALTGSTPPTAQDGQGGAESFNLSQAIADAGSWLRESFDFMKDLRHSSPNTAVAPSDAPGSAFDFDISR